MFYNQVVIDILKVELKKKNYVNYNESEIYPFIFNAFHFVVILSVNFLKSYISSSSFHHQSSYIIYLLLFENLHLLWPEIYYILGFFFLIK